MKKVFILIFLVLISFTVVSALDCQYTEMQTNEVMQTNYYWSNQLLKNGFGVVDINNSNENVEFNIYNPWDFDTKIELVVHLKDRWGDGSIRKITKTIPRNEHKLITVSKKGGDWYFAYSKYELNILDASIDIRKENVLVNETICKQCLGVDCLNDGASCQRNNQCGSGFCVNNICSSSNSCYNGDCGCSSDEIQCGITSCVKKNIVPLDVKPKCNLSEECVSGYINKSSGTCAKSPTQIQEEENQRLKDKLKEKEKQKKFWTRITISLVSLLILGSLGIWYFRNKYEKEKQNTEKEKQKTIDKEKEKELAIELEKQKTIQNNLQLEITKADNKRREIEVLEQSIRRIKKQKKLQKKELEELEYLRKSKDKKLDELNKLNNHIQSKWSELKPFPDPDASNRLVIINPYLGGYKCFYDKKLSLENYPISSLVHRWVWKKHNGRSPRPGFHIHHIDEDKYNNDPRNLEEINGKEHYQLHSK